MKHSSYSNQSLKFFIEKVVYKYKRLDSGSIGVRISESGSGLQSKRWELQCQGHDGTRPCETVKSA